MCQPSFEVYPMLLINNLVLSFLIKDMVPQNNPIEDQYQKIIYTLHQGRHLHVRHERVDSSVQTLVCKPFAVATCADTIVAQQLMSILLKIRITNAFNYL
jgi:hypothetical protein